MRAYPQRVSVWPGNELVLHCSVSVPRFQVRFLHWGARPRWLGQTGTLIGHDAPAGRCDEDWAWPAVRWMVPEDWPPGVVIAVLHAVDERPQLDLAAPSGAALLVVRGPGRAPLLVKLPLSTWHAYNHSGGGCFYDQPRHSVQPPGAKVSLQRPGGGIGGPVFGAQDHYDPATPRQCFGHWDAPFLVWLTQQGFAHEVCTDLDVDAEPDLLPRHHVVVSACHDEYWTTATREHTEQFVEAGGHLAIFGGNTCWWRTRCVDAGRALVCHQGGPHGALDHWWPASGAGRPEEHLTGLAYRFGGGWWDGARRVDGYEVLAADHWAFAGTGLGQGARFGARAVPPLPGYESDGVAQAAWLAPATPGVQVLARSVLSDHWQERPALDAVARHTPGMVAVGASNRRPAAPAGHVANAAMTLRVAGKRGGMVFNAGSTDWPQVVANGSDPVVARITDNVLRRLLDE